MVESSKSTSGPRTQVFLARHPVLTLDAWAHWMGGDRRARARARLMARYYTRTGRLRQVTRGVYAPVPPGADQATFTPDPYLVALALRADAILSHHAALDLLGASRSVFRRFTYLTRDVRRPLRAAGLEWRALAHPSALVRARQIDLGVVTLDRRGVHVRVTGAERTLVDGFAALTWVGGVEEHVDSAASFRDLDLSLLEQYLHRLDRASLFAAVGWFLEGHPETAEPSPAFMARLERRAPGQPFYLGPRHRGARLVRRWNMLVPARLAVGEHSSAPN